MFKLVLQRLSYEILSLRSEVAASRTSTMLFCWLLLQVASCLALRSEVDLQNTWLAAVSGQGQIESAGPVSQDYKQGRVTNYAYNQAGSCGYGPIFPDESLGQPLGILAIPDCSPLFPGSCGLCFEVKCYNSVFEDDNGLQLDRSTACYDESSSVVLRNVDSCPSYYPANLDSNNRWCRCQNLPHFDISSESFAQLADLKWGVIGMQWRQVTCDYQPTNPAPVRDSTMYATPLPDSSQDLHRTQIDWTGLKASWVTVEDYQDLNPQQVNPPNIYSTAAGDLLPGWQMYNVQSGNAMPANTSAPTVPVTTGRGGTGTPKCVYAGSGQGLGFYSTVVNAANTTLLQFWVYSGNITSFDAAVTIGNYANSSGTCPYTSLDVVKPITQDAGWISYSIFVPSLQGTDTCSAKSDLKLFFGCEGRPAKEINAVYFLNSRPDPQWMCLDDVLWR